MANLVKCSLCGRNVSNECKACPGCGHDVARELRANENEKKKMWEELGLCRECGKNEFVEVKKSEYVRGLYTLHKKQAECATCGWIDDFNYNYHIVSDDPQYAGDNGVNYSKQGGNGTWWGLRKQKY